MNWIRAERTKGDSYLSWLSADLINWYLPRFFRGWVDSSRWSEPFREIGQFELEGGIAQIEFLPDEEKMIYLTGSKKEVRVYDLAKCQSFFLRSYDPLPTQRLNGLTLKHTASGLDLLRADETLQC